jgi:GrpB-like predicted nucleotidyltransferase (UPF0157 family)
MKIVLAEYNSDWPVRFERECDVLRKIIGKDNCSIEHIGSTSVPGLLSKPIIDIMVGLKDFRFADGLAEQFVERGYEYYRQYEDTMPYRRFFKKIDKETVTHHIHMVEIASEFWQRHLLFRDYLRNNPDIAAEYAALKTELAKQEWETSNDFSQAKTEFIKRVEKLSVVSVR